MNKSTVAATALVPLAVGGMAAHADGLSANVRASGSSYGPDYTDCKVGATYDFGNGFSLSGAIVGADKEGDYGDINKTA